MARDEPARNRRIRSDERELLAGDRRLHELMALRTRMRELTLRAMESGPGRLVVTLGAGAALDPVRMAQLVAWSKEGLKLTPEMKLISPLPAHAPGIEVDLLEHAHKMR